MTSFFPKPRPAFDLEIYDYLIEKGYPFVPNEEGGREECYLFLGDEDYIEITPYESSFISLRIYESNVFLDLSNSYGKKFKCPDLIIKTIFRALRSIDYKDYGLITDKTTDKYIYKLRLKISSWKEAIDYFYNKIVPIIDKTLRKLKSKHPECQEVIDTLKITDEEFEELKQRLEDRVRYCRNKLIQRQHPLNLILYGPPGTSKTYSAVIYAVAMIENLLIEEVLDEPRDEVLERYKEYLNNGQIVFTTFHPSYSYEDFIEGLKAKVENGQVQYYVEDGIFKEIVKRAKENPDKNYVIIIDEINRGNIPSIFGELITLIEEDKREGMPNAISVKLPYSKEDFSIPSNLYILGTMNTADRSIALLDIALRRRFEFEELMPRPDLLKDIKVIDDNNNPLDIDLEKLLECLNKRIEKNLDRNKTIGHAYFLSFVNQNQLTLADLSKIFKNKIIPLLQEYFYDDWDKIREVLNDNDGQFIQKDKSRISDELNSLSLKEDAFINIYQNCENAGNNQV